MSRSVATTAAQSKAKQSPSKSESQSNNTSSSMSSTPTSLESAISAAMLHIDSRSQLVKPESLNAADVVEIIQLQKKEKSASSGDSLSAAIRHWNELRATQKRAAARLKSKSHTQPSRSERAGINFPVGKMTKQLKKGQYSQRIGGGAPVYIAAVLEYLTTELLDLAGQQAKKHAGGDEGKSNEGKAWKIQPSHLAQAMNEDDELSSVMKLIMEHKKTQQENKEILTETNDSAAANGATEEKNKSSENEKQNDSEIAKY